MPFNLQILVISLIFVGQYLNTLRGTREGMRMYDRIVEEREKGGEEGSYWINAKNRIRLPSDCNRSLNSCLDIFLHINNYIYLKFINNII